jgi:Protein of unknown function (DUF1569)
MKNLYEPARMVEVQARLAQLRTDSARQWGTMEPAQAVAHCSIAMTWAVGDALPDRQFIGRIFGLIVKKFALGNDAPMKRNSPTAPSLIVKNERELEVERTKLGGLLTRFAAAGPSGCTKNPHPFFGPLTPAEWAELMYKHVDHHLRQFGA